MTAHPKKTARECWSTDSGHVERYSAEIRDHRDDLERLRDLTRKGAVTLVYAAHDQAHNDAIVLREILLACP